MQRFERSRVPPPATLRESEAQRNRIALRDYLRTDALKRAQTTAGRGLELRSDGFVAGALADLFHGKCAFCERRTPTVPYRFRPQAEARPFVATETGHLYYAWLSDAWENIYAICNECMPREADYFPVRGARARLPTDHQLDRYVEEGIGLWRDHPPQEKPLLLDPCGRSELYAHFHVKMSGELLARTDAAIATIEQFNLQRPTLIDARNSTYQQRIQELIAALTLPRSDRGSQGLFAFADQEFGGSWFILLRRLAGRVRDRGLPLPTVSRSGIEAGFRALYGRYDLRERLTEALEALEEEDSRPFVQAVPPPPRHSRARLTAVQIRNFRSIESLDLDMPELALDSDARSRSSEPSILILGENAAGKSSLLEAIALTLADPAARKALKLKPVSMVLNPAFLGAEPDDVQREAKVTLTMDRSSSHSLAIADNDYQSSGASGVPMPPVFAYGAFRHYVDRRRKHGPAKYIQNLFHPDQLLSNPERWLFGLEKTRFDMVVRALRDIFSIEGEFDVIKRNPETKQCLIIARVPRPDGSFVEVSTPLSIASSGFRSVLAMVCDIFEGLMDDRVHQDFDTLAAARAVVLIDEVEAHLHPRWKMQIMRGLRTALPSVTFIATTHDPLCLRGMGDREVKVMQKVSNDGTAEGTNLPVFVEQLRDVPSVSELTLAQLLTSDLFQLFSTDTAETDARLASVGDLLARQRAGQPLRADELKIITDFNDDITSALPVGSSAVHRLVQDAVAEYLRERRTASETRLRNLSEKARRDIVDALRGL